MKANRILAGLFLLAPFSMAQSAAPSPAGATLNRVESLTSDPVERRFARGKELFLARHYDLALRELFWCFDEDLRRADPRLPNHRYAANQLKQVSKILGAIGEKYSPARPALQSRYDALAAQIAANPLSGAEIPALEAFEGALGVYRTGLGALEATWQRGEQIYAQKISLGLFFETIVRVDALESGGRYYYFKNGSLVKISPERLSARTIARLKDRAIVEPALVQAPLGTKESAWLKYFGSRAVLQTFPNSVPTSGTTYRLNGTFFTFQWGVLVAVSTSLENAGKLAPPDLAAIRKEYFAASHLGESLKDWQRPLVYREGGITCYEAEGEFHFFKNGVLVMINRELTPLVEVEQIDEIGTLVAHVQGPLKRVIAEPILDRPAIVTYRGGVYDPPDPTGLGADWERTSKMSRE